MSRTWRCTHCDDVIGVYEPMIVLANGQARYSSRFEEQDDGREVGECYHRDCYVHLHGEDPAR